MQKSLPHKAGNSKQGRKSETLYRAATIRAEKYTGHDARKIWDREKERDKKKDQIVLAWLYGEPSVAGRTDRHITSQIH